MRLYHGSYLEVITPDLWLEFIMNCRRGKDATDYDIVIGGVANDKALKYLNFEGSEVL